MNFSNIIWSEGSRNQNEMKKFVEKSRDYNLGGSRTASQRVRGRSERFISVCGIFFLTPKSIDVIVVVTKKKIILPWQLATTAIQKHRALKCRNPSAVTVHMSYDADFISLVYYSVWSAARTTTIGGGDGGGGDKSVIPWDRCSNGRPAGEATALDKHGG